MPDRERETFIQRDRERASRDRIGLVILFVAGAAIVLVFGKLAPGYQTSGVGQAESVATAYVVDFATPMDVTATQPPVDYGLLPSSTPEQFSPFSPEVQQWAKKAEEWSQLHGQGRVPQGFILSIIQVESVGDPNAGYPDSESLGLFQIWDEHLEVGGKCEGINPFDPDDAARCAVGILMPRAIESATRNGHANYLAAAVGYHLPEAIPWVLGEESPEQYIARMGALGHNGANLLDSATLFRDGATPLLTSTGLR